MMEGGAGRTVPPSRAGRFRRASPADPARDPGLPFGPRPRLLRQGVAAGRAVRLSRRRPLLLPALPAGAGRVGRGALAALAVGGECRDAPPGEPDGGRPLSGQGPVCDLLLSLGGPALRRRPYTACVRRHLRPDALL